MKNGTKTHGNTKIKTTLFITYTAILIAIAIICNTFDIPIGNGALKLTFSYIPCFIAGIFLGPIAGFLVGFLGDLLGFLINSQGMAWIPLLTISSAFIGFLPGLIFKIPKLKLYFKLALSFLAVFLVCTCFLTTLGLYLFFAIGKKTFWVYFIGRIGPQLGFFLINCCIICILYYPLKKYVFSRIGNKIATTEDIEGSKSTNDIEKSEHSTSKNKLQSFIFNTKTKINNRFSRKKTNNYTAENIEITTKENVND